MNMQLKDTNRKSRPLRDSAEDHVCESGWGCERRGGIRYEKPLMEKSWANMFVCSSTFHILWLTSSHSTWTWPLGAQSVECLWVRGGALPNLKANTIDPYLYCHHKVFANGDPNFKMVVLNIAERWIIVSPSIYFPSLQSTCWHAGWHIPRNMYQRRVRFFLLTEHASAC